jgi:hypothetical protein
MVVNSVRTVAAGLCLLLFQAAIADDSGAPVRPSRGSSRQVQVIRLLHADAASLVKEYSGLFDSNVVRLVAYEKANSLVVSAPPEMQKAVRSLISKLDVPQAGGEVPGRTDRAAETALPPKADSAARRTAPAEASPSNRATDADTVAVVRASPQSQRAVNGLFSVPGRIPSSESQPPNANVVRPSVTESKSIAQAMAELFPPGGISQRPIFIVEKADPATRRAIEALAGRSNEPTVAVRTPAQNQPTEITVLRVPGAGLAALVKALAKAEAANSPGPRIRSVVITPPTGSTDEARETGRPAENQRR